MKVVGLRKIESFLRRHADVRPSLSAWLYEVEEVEWHSPNDIKARYAHASFLKNNRVIFNTKGNNYRIDTKINYKNKVVIVKRIGTHAEYSKWRF